MIRFRVQFDGLEIAIRYPPVAIAETMRNWACSPAPVLHFMCAAILHHDYRRGDSQTAGMILYWDSKRHSMNAAGLGFGTSVWALVARVASPYTPADGRKLRNPSSYMRRPHLTTRSEAHAHAYFPSAVVQPIFRAGRRELWSRSSTPESGHPIILPALWAFSFEVVGVGRCCSGLL